MKSGNSVNLLCLGIVIPLLLLSGCATTKGKVSDGSYHAPLGNFVLPLDRGNIRIQDKNDARSGMVSVLDDMGNNEGITPHTAVSCTTTRCPLSSGRYLRSPKSCMKNSSARAGSSFLRGCRDPGGFVCNGR